MNDLLNNNSMIKEIKELLLTARQNVAVQVNSELLTTYWQIGRIIVEHDHDNNVRSNYGKFTLKQLSNELTKEFGRGSLVLIYKI